MNFYKDELYLNTLATKVIMNTLTLKTVNKSGQIQFKFNIYGLIKLSLLTLSVSLLLGSYARANAQSPQQDEVLSIPPREAYYIEEHTQATSKPNRNNLGNTATLNRGTDTDKNGHKLAPTPRPATLNSPSRERSKN